LGALPPRDTSALARSVRDRLRLAIVLQEIPAGVRLNQVQVAEQLGVSRMPVRVAAADLVIEGLLEPLPTGGVAVRSLSKRDVEGAYKVREALEAQAVRDVAFARPEAGLKELFAILKRHEDLGGVNDTPVLLELDRAFHGTILDATDNPYFSRAMVPMWSVVERAMVGMLRTVPDLFDTAWKQHRQIAEALAVGDADLAERLAREHIRDSALKFTNSIGGE
jgi:DNA-binding GntR family transcriptional regulator